MIKTLVKRSYVKKLKSKELQRCRLIIASSLVLSLTSGGALSQVGDKFHPAPKPKRYDRSFNSPSLNIHVRPGVRATTELVIEAPHEATKTVVLPAGTGNVLSFTKTPGGHSVIMAAGGEISKSLFIVDVGEGRIVDTISLLP